MNRTKRTKTKAQISLYMRVIRFILFRPDLPFGDICNSADPFQTPQHAASD